MKLTVRLIVKLGVVSPVSAREQFYGNEDVVTLHHVLQVSVVQYIPELLSLCQDYKHWKIKQETAILTNSNISQFLRYKFAMFNANKYWYVWLYEFKHLQSKIVLYKYQIGH